MLTWKRVVAAVFILCVAAVVAGVAILKSVDVNEYRGLIAEKAKEATGRELTIDGRMHLEISLNPAIAVDGVTFANAPWGTRPEMLRLERFAAEVELLPLLSGDVRVKRLVLSGLDLLMETDKQGRGNWEMPAPADARRPGPDSGAPARLPAVDRVELNDVTLTYRDGESGKITTFRLAGLDIHAEGVAAPMMITLKGALDKEPIEARGTIGPAKSLIGGGPPYPVDLAIKALGAEVTLIGTLANPRDLAGLDLAVRARGTDLGRVLAGLRPRVAALAALPDAPLGPFDLKATLKGGRASLALAAIDASLGSADRVRLTARGAIADALGPKGLDLAVSIEVGDAAPLARAFGAEVPRLPPTSLTGRLSDIRGGYQLDGLNAKAGDSDLTGRAVVKLFGVVRPTVEAELKSNNLDVDALVPRRQKAPALPAAPTGDARVFPADPLPVEALRALDARVRVDAKRVVVGGMTLADVGLTAVLGAGRLDLKPVEAGVAGGRVRGDLVLDGAARTTAVSIDLDARGVDYGGLLKQFELTDIASGRLDAKIDVKGRGESIRAIMAGLNGRLRITSEGGRVESGLLNVLSADVTSALPFFDSKGDKDIQCAVVDFDVRAGQAEARSLLFETGGLSLIGSGKIDLATEKLDMHVEPRAKKVSVLKLASVPVDVGGTLASPSVTPDVAGAAVGTVTGAVSTAKDIATGVAKGGVETLGKIVGLGRKDGPAGGTVDQTDYCKLALAGKPLVPAKASKPPQPVRQTAPKTAPATTSPTTQEKLDKKLDEIGKGLGGSLKGLFGK